MKLIQLDPHLPVTITSRNNSKATAIGWIDYGQEEHLVWITADDETGEIWCVQNPEIRLRPNWTARRGRKSMGFVG